MPTLHQFIGRVVPWPGAGAPGVVNIHWRAKNQTTGNFFWGGRPQTSPDSFVSMVQWANGRPNFIQDIYFCLSLQSQIGKYSRGKPTVARSADNAMALKAVWLDIDVKDPPKGYATREEALRTLDMFIKASSLPFPTCIVGSGGGLHVYWISDRPLTVDEWRPYAEGLKAAALQYGLRCDAGLTTDCARILRVPETQNFKTTPPRPVEILFLADLDYKFDEALQSIALHGVTTITATVKHAPAYDLSAFVGKKPIMEFVDDHLSDGLKREDNPLDPRPIVRGCPFFKDAFKTHGKNHTQPLWNLAILSTTFFEKGDALAHEIGNAHPGYTAASTDAMYERKLKERQQKKLGWPSCKAIEGEGCGFCKTCPHFGKIKSPLNLALSAPPQSPLTPAALQAAQPPDLMLPKSYAVDPKTGIICYVAELPIDRGPAIQQLVPLFKCVLSNPWIQAGPSALNFKTTTDKGRSRDVSIPEAKMASMSSLMVELFNQGVLPNTQIETKVREFIVSWKAAIQDRVQAQQTVPFGWVVDGDGGEVKGFAFGGKVMHKKPNEGQDTPSGYGDNEIRHRYEPTGKIETWFKAMKMITDQNRPDLEIIIATAFAAPLMQFVGKDMVTFSAWGDSGAHKSTALKIAAAVWGHHKLTVEVHTSTAKGVLKRIGQIVNLPLFWDELSDTHTIEHVFKTMFVGNQGVEGSTLKSDRSSNARGMWRTILSINLNQSFLDYVAKRQRSTDAGVYRVFEYWVEKKESTLSEAVVSNMIQDLEYNYGNVGLKFAKLISQDPDAIKAWVMEEEDKWAKLVNATGPERNWVAACTVVLCGAALANACGCEFHIEGIKQQLYKAYIDLRHRRTTLGNATGSMVSVRDVVLEWLRDKADHTIWTRSINMGRGKPRANEIIWPRPSPQGKQFPVLSQFGIENRILRISRKAFVSWLDEKEYAPAVTLRGLANHFNVVQKEAALGSGTTRAEGQEALIQFPIEQGSPLEPMLYSKTPPDEWPEHLKNISDEEPTGAATGIEQAVAQAAQDLETVKAA